LPLRMWRLQVETALDGAIGHRAGELVRRVATPVTAEHIAGELVEYDDERERTLRGVFPSRQLAFAGGVPEGRKASCDLGVEQRVLLEPLVGSGGAPECEHVRGLDRLGCAEAAGHSRTRPALICSYSAGSTRTNALRCGSLK